MEIILSKLFMNVVYTLQFLSVVWAFDQLLEPRFTRKLSYIISLSVHFVVISIHLTVTHFSPEMSTVGYFIYDTARFLTAAAGLFVSYKGNPLKMLFTFILVLYGCSTLASAITAVFIPYGENAELLQDYPVLATVMCFFLWLLTSLAVFALKKISARSLPKNFLLYLIFPITQYFSSLIISDLLVFVPEEEHHLKVIAFWITAFGIVADIVLLLIIVRMNDNEEARRKLETEAYARKSEEAYYEHINEKLAAAMKIRHDMKNVLIAAENLLGDSDTREDGRKLIELLKNSADETEPKYYCEHKIINAVLYDKSEKAAANGIDINVNASVPEDISVDCYDLCRVFSNVLDNAAESAVQTENPMIDFSCQIRKGYLYIESKNSCRPEKVRKGLLTTKKDKTNHGHGTAIIKEIADRYNGESKFISEGNLFSCKVWLKI
ncbi:MAG: GHKL domain-containing protein [Oscillospiraceae bacterium]|nr:GHKL domain-containing protein [Oscillospiraceae bacterium]